jgi:FkbM family methyltransferase
LRGIGVRLHEIPPLYLTGVEDVVDVSKGQVDLRQHLQVADTIPYHQYAVEDAEKIAPGPGSALLSLVGPDANAHIGPDELAPVLRRLTPGARAILLVGWPVEELPYHLLLGPLVDAHCQVVEAVATERASIRDVHAALIVECVDRLAPLRSYLLDARPGEKAAATDGPGELRTLLRLANEYVLADLVARPLRRRLIELDRRAAELDERGAELKRQLAERDSRLRDAEKKLAASTKRLAALEGSTTYKVGQAFVRGAKRPTRAVVSVPADLVRLWRSHKRRPSSPAPAPARPVAPPPPKDRVVPIALPPGARDRSLITMTSASDLLVPRRMAELGLAGYERGAMACYLAAIDVAGPGAVLDIGANVGIYAALASAVTARDVVAFEPAPALAEVSRRLAADNELGYPTESIALGAQNGTATFYLSDVSDTSNSLAAGFRESSKQIEVPVETLDSYVARTGAVPAVMKVDTETTEPDVLAGATKTVAEHKPWILCEVLAGRVEERLTEVVTPFGYHWYHVTDHLPYQEATQIVGDKTYEHLMWLFTPEPLGDDFWAALRARTAELAECTPQRGLEIRGGK